MKVDGPPNVVGTAQSMEDPNRIKRWRKVEYALCLGFLSRDIDLLLPIELMLTDLNWHLHH